MFDVVSRKGCVLLMKPAILAAKSGTSADRDPKRGFHQERDEAEASEARALA